MAIKLSDLPPELRRLVLAEAGLKPTAPQRRPRILRTTPRLSRVCSCLFEMFRPDGDYPDRCDGCGGEWPKT
jgi:hypothetical protein